MNPITITIGGLALLFGLYSIYARIKNPSSLGKLDAMKEKWGDQAGLIVHVISYTIVPICVGLYFIYLGIQGASFF